jgi:hypothetical protein
MSRPLGGRGKVAPYRTTHLRIPIPIKEDVEKLIEDYRKKVIDGIEPENDGLMSLAAVIELSKKLLRSKSAKIDCIAKLLTAIYRTDITREDLVD